MSFLFFSSALLSTQPIRRNYPMITTLEPNFIQNARFSSANNDDVGVFQLIQFLITMFKTIFFCSILGSKTKTTQTEFTSLPAYRSYQRNDSRELLTIIIQRGQAWRLNILGKQRRICDHFYQRLPCTKKY